MQHARQIINSQQLRQFNQLNKLSDEDAKELLQTSITVQLSAGTPIFSQANQTKQLFYLIEGELELITSSNKSVIISANTDKARQAFGSHLKNQRSASAKTDITLVSFDADMMDLFLNWTNPNAYLVNEMALNKNHDGLEHLLQSRGLLRFSEEQIQNLLNRMQEIHFNAGDTIIKQDDYDEYYYIVKNGRCSVSRQPDKESSDVKLAELKEGDAFGEEAILTNTPRNANVKMIADGDLMRLSKKDFSEFLAEPLLTTVSIDESHDMLARGAAFLDVRLPEEFATSHIPGSINIPVNLLRLKLLQLSHHRKYIVCCDDASRSAVAAFLLSRNGFDAFILDGGLATTSDLMQQTEPLLEDVVNIEEKDQPQQPEISETTQNAANSALPDILSITEISAPVRPKIKSLADNWGNMVDDADENIFCDLRDVGAQGKTQAITPKNQTKEIQKEIEQPQKAAKIAIDPNINAAGFAELTRRKRNKRILQSGIGLSFIIVAAVFSLPQLGDKISQSLVNHLNLPVVANYLAKHKSTPTKELTVAAAIVTPTDEPPKQIIDNTPTNQAFENIPSIIEVDMSPWISAPENEMSNILIENNLVATEIATETTTMPTITVATKVTTEVIETPAVDPSTRNIISID